MSAERAAPCKHPGAPQEAIVEKVLSIVASLADDRAYLTQRGLSPEEYRHALPAAIEQFRGSRAARNSDRRQFLASVFEEMLSRGLISKLDQPRYGDDNTWSAGVEELRRRTLNRRRESGAFLLGRDEAGAKRILEFVYYDDIDPNALKSGIVHFAGAKLPKLWGICRARGFGVVADVHVHPGGYQQSPSDQADPVIPRAGHLAIIIPHFACRDTKPGGIGLYEYLGNGSWSTHTNQGRAFFNLD